jgi:hypothetical protein
MEEVGQNSTLRIILFAVLFAVLLFWLFGVDWTFSAGFFGWFSLTFIT